MRKFLAIVCGGVFLLLLVITTLALGLRSFVFDANFYVSTLKAKGVFQQLERDPLGLFDLREQIPQLATVPIDMQQRIVAMILPEGWLEKQAASAIDAWLGWFVAGQVGAPKVEIDLRQIKDRLQGPPGQQVAQDVVDAIPTCGANQQPQLSLTQLPECIPAVFNRQAVAEQVAATLSAAAAQMPGQYDIGSRLMPSGRFGLMFNGRRIGVEMLDTSLLLLAVITIGAGVMAALLGGRNGRDRWLWLGGLLLIGSIAVLVISLFVFIFGVALLPQAWLADLTAEVSTIARGLLQAFVQQFALRSLLAGGLWFIVGWGLLAVGLLRKPRLTTSPQYRS
ncbi:MAG TPA: hypothetical protein VMP08_10975 [Anaerolineae bacterium]|nr:hypothetical protein [Anaerolineae bacterium]